MSETKRMRQLGLNVLLWSAFAILILIGASIVLNACDLGLRPLFGSSACQAPAANAALESERAKEAQLQSRIHAEEIHLALLPACPRPAPPPQPQPLPQPQPQPVKVPDPPAPKPPVQTLEIPKKIEDLKGCWQSVRGDIDMTTDDAEARPLGQARICFCFRTNGRGRVQVRYTDGDVCRGDLIARVSPGRVFMHHERANCRRHPNYVAADIICGNGSADQTECEIHNLGDIRDTYTEQFMHVSDEYCGWNG
jgi:hypothetical protein